ncbi:hypothetical protein [Sphaerisporangium flaviroseum]|uniref:hypothetical protein n=1 Tax=Sphaerisporangium flaviroseum TaxID=509199 RepID=UPI0031E54C40
MAKHVLYGFYKQGPKPLSHWQAYQERYFCVNAARHMFRALEMLGNPVEVDKTLRAELKESRDLHEHWDENMPAFNTTPRPRQPQFPSGRAFADRNPHRGPYYPDAWSNHGGAKITPNVSATQLRGVLDAVEAYVLEQYPELQKYLRPRSEASPWIIDEHGGIWPRPVNSVDVEPEQDR